jgi:excisionase family DNA binding protein
MLAHVQAAILGTRQVNKVVIIFVNVANLYKQLKVEYTNMSEYDFLTVDEVANYLRIAPATVREMIKKGRLPAVRIGKVYRVRKSDFERLANTLVEVKTESN